MREAIGSSLLLSIVVVFVSLIILFFVSILSYSKAYKAKNRIIDVIEKYENCEDETVTQDAILEIESSLKEMGYQLGSCKSSNNDADSSYKFCVEKIDGTTEFEASDGTQKKNCYYKVTTYVQFYFPIIGDLFDPPVYGETRMLGNRYNY